MPFDQKPVGFGPEALRLLDVAMTKLWLEQVAVGASQSGADPALRDLLWDQVARLDALGVQRATKRTTSSEAGMEGHKFRVGQRVLYDPPRRTTGSAVFTVVRLLPPEGGERTYRIKSTEENFERAAKERELTSSA